MRTEHIIEGIRQAMKISTLLYAEKNPIQQAALQSFANIGHTNMLDVIEFANKSDHVWIGEYHHYWNAEVAVNAAMQRFRQRHYDRFGTDIMQMPEVRRLPLPLTVKYLPELVRQNPPE